MRGWVAKARADDQFCAGIKRCNCNQACVLLNNHTEPSVDGVAESWEGDGSTDTHADDPEWGGDAPARNGANDGDDTDATELARSQESLTSFLHRQALALRLSETDRAALRFLIESLNDDGYLEDSLLSLAQGLAGDDEEQIEELQERFQMALHLLHSLEPVGVGARASAAKSQIVKSVSWPTPETMGMRDSCTARATISSLNDGSLRNDAR